MTNRLNPRALKHSCVLALTLIAAGLFGCAPEKSLESASPGTFTAVYSQTLRTACIQCHASGSAQGSANLDFSSQSAAYASLVNRPVVGAVSNGSGQCSGVKLVKPSDTSGSFLMATLSNLYPQSNVGGVAGCFPYSIHQTDQNLSAAEISSLAQWIAGGALNN
jgi:hypothetical protein